jgi:recombination protein RecT
MSTELITQSLRDNYAAISQSLPSHIDGKRFARIILTEVRKSDIQRAAGVTKTSLSECSPESVIGAVLTAATLGLEIGVNGEAYLVPYRVKGRAEAQLIIGYQGVAKMAWQHPMVRGIDARAVYEGEVYEVTYGTNPAIVHIPSQHPEDANPVAYYAVVTLSSGGQIIEALTPEQVRRLRKGKVGSSGDIPDPQHWMERKTVLRQALKLAPKTAELGAVLAADDGPATHLFKAPTSPPPAAWQGVPGLTATDVDIVTGEVLAGSLIEEPAEYDYDGDLIPAHTTKDQP